MGLFLRGFDRGKKVLETVQWGSFLRVQDLAKVTHGVIDILPRARQSGPASISMAAALKFFGNFSGLAIAAAQTGNDGAVGPAEQRDEDRIGSGLLLKKLMDDQVVVPNDRIDEADGRGDLGDVAFAPG